MDDTRDRKISCVLRHDLGIEQIEQELVILDKRNHKVHQLNTTASRVWAGIEQGLDLSSIAKGIVEEYDVPLDSAYRDIGRLIQEFAKLELLEVNYAQ